MGHMTDRILIVGAGAVGTSYAHVLARGGASVSFYVRPPRVAQTRAGLPLLELNTRGVAVAHEVRAEAVLASPDEVRSARAFDQIWLTVPSTALSGDWLGELFDAAPDAAIVSLSPGVQDRELVAELAGEERAVAGLIVLVAWHGALPGETSDAPGVRAWFPPLVKTPYSGPRAPEIAAALNRGGVRARVVPDAAAQGAPGNAMLQAGVAGLECAGWSLDGFRSGPYLERALAAGRQAAAIAAAHHGRRPPRAFAIAKSWVLRPGIPVAGRIFPADLETYLRVHFSKVGAQTSAALHEYLSLATEHGLAFDAIEALAEELAAVRNAGSGS